MQAQAQSLLPAEKAEGEELHLDHPMRVSACLVGSISALVGVRAGYAESTLIVCTSTQNASLEN
eukprot:326022-Pelagomonas_calceolata.AAC.1